MNNPGTYIMAQADTTSQPPSAKYETMLTESLISDMEKTALYTKGKTLPDRDVPCAPQPYSLRNDTAISLTLILMFAAISTIIYRSGHHMMGKTKAFFKARRQYTSTDESNPNSSEARNNTMLIIVSSLSLSIILFEQLAGKADWLLYDTTKPYLLLLAETIGLLLITTFKATLYSIVNWVFFSKEQSRNWMLSYIQLNALTAFILYPFSLISVLVGLTHIQVAFCSIFFFLIYEMLLLYRLLINFKTKKYGTLLIFLYFCTVEIISSLVLWLLLNDTGDGFIIKI